MSAAERHPDLFGGDSPVVGLTTTRTVSYPAAPGSGPDGETCGSCARHVVREFAKRYHKCALTETASEASDIRVGMAACRFWEAK